MSPFEDDGIDGIGITATDQVAEFLVDGVDGFTLVVFGGKFLQLLGHQVADPPSFLWPKASVVSASKTISPPSNNIAPPKPGPRNSGWDFSGDPDRRLVDARCVLDAAPGSRSGLRLQPWWAAWQ